MRVSSDCTDSLDSSSAFAVAISGRGRSPELCLLLLLLFDFFRRCRFSAGCREIDVRKVSSSRSVGVVMGLATGEEEESEESNDPEVIVEIEEVLSMVFKPLRDKLRNDDEELSVFPEATLSNDALDNSDKDDADVRREDLPSGWFLRDVTWPSLIRLRFEMDCNTRSGSSTCIVLLKASRPAEAADDALFGANASEGQLVVLADEVAERGRAVPQPPRSAFFGRSVFLSAVDEEDGRSNDIARNLNESFDLTVARI